MTTEIESYTVQVFTPAPDALFPIDVAAHLAQVSRHRVLVYCRRGLVAVHHDPVHGGFYFDQDAVRTLQRIEYLHIVCGVNLAGIELILKLMADVAELRALTRD